MANTEVYNVGFVDSGTTFTYMPTGLLKIIRAHFIWFCDSAPNHCLGKFEADSRDDICF